MNNQISIITPSYQQARYLEQTIQSVLQQKTYLIELIIIDGGSADESIEIIKKYANQLSWWISEKDRGQSHAINKGVKKATGHIINWLNSDDYYTDNALKIINQHFYSKDIKGVFGRSRLFNEKGTLGYSLGTDIYPGNLPKTIGWARIDQPESFFLREAWDKVGMLNENLQYCMDREWWMRYLYHFGIDGLIKIPDILVNFRIHANSKTQLQQAGFFREHHSLFYQLGVVAGEKSSLDMIYQNLDIDKSLPTNIRYWNNSNLCKESFNYYLLKTADEFYAQDKIELSKAFLKYIDPYLLENEDMKLYKRLKLRVQIPLSIIHFFRTK
ncbi:MAG: glycosyltransferase [Cyclobacteriaceae bacterium]|nr:glycosyltransferase [Cyclobacteriaceae bacterium]